MKRAMHLLILSIILGIVYFYLEGWSRWAAGSLVGFEVGDMVQSMSSMTGWSSQWMVIVGGLCGLFIGLLNEFKLTARLPLVVLATISVVFIIWPLEFISGCILNDVFDWSLRLGVWDYSHLPLNIKGQVAIALFPAFFGTSVIAIWLDDVLRHWIMGEVRPESFWQYVKNTLTFKPTP